MAKDPAVLFYIQDFLIGVSFLTPLQKGHYITLLCHQQQSETGSLREDHIKTLMGKDFVKQWPAIKAKFKQDENGFYNERMRKEVDRRKQYSEKQRKKITDYWKNRGNTVEDTTVIPNNGNSFLETETEIRKGGAGEKQNLKTWDSQKAQFLQHTEWMTNFCRSKNISANQFDILAKEFVSDLELKLDYKPIKEIKSHFTSWFNKNKPNLLQNLSSQKNGLSAREIEEKKNREKLGLND
jgi:uncharacterized protein YdaU (DUF1376 family)